MTWILPLLALALLLLPLVISIRRATELFKVKIRAGRARFVRGRMPQSLLDDLGDVARSARIEHADLWVVRRRGRPELLTKGELSREQLQRLRNTIAGYTAQRIAAGGKPGKRRR